MYSKRQKDILEFLYPDKVCAISALEKKFKFDNDTNMVLRKLRTARLIQLSADSDIIQVSLTESGIAYVEQLKTETKQRQEEKRTSKIHFWIPVIISILALLIALASLIVDIFQLSQQNSQQQSYQSNSQTDTRDNNR